MAQLIVLMGASGAGKTFVLSEMQKYRNDIEIVKKLTTRPPRRDEDNTETIDLLLSKSCAEVKECNYTYLYSEHTYGINKNDINQVLMKNINPILIVAKFSALKKLNMTIPMQLLSLYKGH